MRVPAEPLASSQHLRLDVTDSRCSRTLEPAIIAAQAYDVVNTARQLNRYPQSRESDWWTAMFAGSSGRNMTGIVIGIALNDFIKWRLTAHSEPLRCIIEVNQFTTTIEAIQMTHPR